MAGAMLIGGSGLVEVQTVPGYKLNDETVVDPAAVDWEGLYGGHAGHVRDGVLAGPVASGGLTAHLLAICARTWGAVAVVDTSAVADAAAVAAETAGAAAVARENLTAVVRSCYKAGATAAELAELAGLSVGRVYQVVAGARPR